MKEVFLVLSFFIFITVNIYSQNTNFPELIGPYLDQKPPGLTPEIFAPGIISLEGFHDFKGAFSPDGNEYYFCRHSLPKIQPTLYFMKTENGIWTKPSELSIAQGTRTFHPCISSDNKM